MGETVRGKRFHVKAKRCPRCNTLRAIECFGRRRKDGPRQSYCKLCMAAYMRGQRKKQRAIVEVAVRMRERLLDDLIWKGNVNVKVRSKQAVEELRRRYDGKAEVQKR